MFIRYKRDKNGKPVPHAYIFSQAEHHIDISHVDAEAVRIVERLKSAGHQAYIVGGAVRDLAQGRTPKDFDLVTDAIPAKIRKLFRNARIIGKRFRLVHIIQGGTIYEVSTFRSIKNGSVGNEFGTIDEDAQRRDFTFNALYYDPTDQSLVDFVGGLKDLQAGKLKPIIPLDAIFQEDPVRIVRGLKYAAIGGFSIPLGLRRAMRKEAALLSKVSPSRMTEEFFKILGSGHATEIFKILSEYKIVEYFVPALWEKMQSDIEFSTLFFKDMEELDALKVSVQDAELESGEGADPYRGKQKLSQVLSFFLKAWVTRENLRFDDSSEAFRLALQAARSFLQPMNPPRVELEAAVLMIFRNSGISPLQRPQRPRRRRQPARTGAKTAGE